MDAAGEVMGERDTEHKRCRDQSSVELGSLPHGSRPSPKSQRQLALAPTPQRGAKLSLTRLQKLLKDHRHPASANPGRTRTPALARESGSCVAGVTAGPASIVTLSCSFPRREWDASSPPACVPNAFRGVADRLLALLIGMLKSGSPYDAHYEPQNAAIPTQPDDGMAFPPNGWLSPRYNSFRSFSKGPAFAFTLDKWRGVQDVLENK